LLTLFDPHAALLLSFAGVARTSESFARILLCVKFGPWGVEGVAKGVSRGVRRGFLRIFC